jgi:hypothetical protein
MYDFNVTIKTDPSTIRNVKFLTFYDYQIEISEYTKEELRAMAYIDVDTPIGAGYVYVDGTLQFKQKNALRVDMARRKVYNETLLHYESTSENYLPRLLHRYNR